MLLQIIVILISIVWQTAPATPLRSALDYVGLVISLITAIGLLVAIGYFFWHSKNRDELTKALAEATSLATTRGERIKDLEKEKADLKAEILDKEKEIRRMEREDERKTKAEFRLRAQINEYESRLGIKP